jgi:hypothetical protein
VFAQASSSGSSAERTLISAKLTIISLDSVNGPSGNVTFPPEAVTCVPRSRPPVASSTPALVSSSTKRAISAKRSLSGGLPPPLTVIRNRIADSSMQAILRAVADIGIRCHA